MAHKQHASEFLQLALRVDQIMQSDSVNSQDEDASDKVKSLIFDMSKSEKGVSTDASNKA